VATEKTAGKAPVLRLAGAAARVGGGATSGDEARQMLEPPNRVTTTLLANDALMKDGPPCHVDRLKPVPIDDCERAFDCLFQPPRQQ